MLVSVVIPVYNAEIYLRNCLESVLNQCCDDFEVLLIDDGSQDNSGRICDFYGNKYTNVRVFHKENDGVSSARNLGIQMAKGDWVTFVDSDDVISPDYIFSFVNEIDNSSKHCDLIMQGATCLNGKGKKNAFITFENESLTPYSFINKYALYPFLGMVWAKLYKRTILLEHKLFFDESFDWGEDVLFNTRYLTYCNHISTLSKQTYEYKDLSTGLSKKRPSIDLHINLTLAVKSNIEEIKPSISCSIISGKLSYLILPTIREIYGYRNDANIAISNNLHQLRKIIAADLLDVLLSIYKEAKGIKKMSYLLLKFKQIRLFNLVLTFKSAVRSLI